MGYAILTVTVIALLVGAAWSSTTEAPANSSNEISERRQMNDLVRPDDHRRVRHRVRVRFLTR